VDQPAESISPLGRCLVVASAQDGERRASELVPAAAGRVLGMTVEALGRVFGR